MMKPLEENMWENLYNLELVDSLEWFKIHDE